MKENMKNLEAIKKFPLFLCTLLYVTIVSIPGYIIWVVVSRRRMNKRYLKSTKRNRKKYCQKYSDEKADTD